MLKKKNESSMLIQFTNIKYALSKLIALSLCLGLVAACATSPSSGGKKEGPLNAKERLERIKTTGSSKDPKNDDTKNEIEVTEDSSTKEKTSDEPTQQDSEDAFLDASETTYTLPKAKQRLREQPSVDKDFKNSYKEALKALQKGIENKQFDDALQQFKSLENQNTELSGPSTNIGIIYLHQEKYEEAEKAFLKALEINNENEFAYNNLGLTYRELGKFPEAKMNYQAAIELDPKYAEAHYNLGVLAELYLQDLELAIQSFERYKLAHREKDQQVDTWLVDLKNRLNAERQREAKAAAEANQQAQTKTEPVTATKNIDETTTEETTTEESSTPQQESSDTTQETTPERQGETQ
jgi:tetratricopeptide (TPR) repeat protein